MNDAHAAQGMHMLADLDGVDPGMLRDAGMLERVLKYAAREARATVLFSHFHAFGDGGGVTGVVLLAESHISIHTWPEHGFAAVDIFMCGSANAECALRMIEGGLRPAACVRRTVPRGAF